MVPPQLPPEVLSARMLLTSVTLAGAPYIAPPPKVALLPEKVLLVTVRGPPLAMAPPSSLALLPEKVLLVTVRGPPLAMAPPSPLTLLPEKVLLVTIRKFKLEMGPPAVPPLLAERLLLCAVAVPPSRVVSAPQVPRLP